MVFGWWHGRVCGAACGAGSQYCGQRSTYAAVLQVVHGDALSVLAGLQPEPHAVFVGGGFTQELFHALRARLTHPWRLVVNAVALETQALLMELHRTHGGQLLQLQWSEAKPLGSMHSWEAARPLVQWSWSCP